MLINIAPWFPHPPSRDSKRSGLSLLHKRVNAIVWRLQMRRGALRGPISVFLTLWPDKENHLQEHLQRVGDGDWHSHTNSGHGLTQVVDLGRDEHVEASKGEPDSSGPHGLVWVAPVWDRSCGSSWEGNILSQGTQGLRDPSLLLNLLSLSQGKSLEECLVPGLPSYLRKCA